MKYLIALLSLVSFALAQNNTGVLVIDTLRPKGSADTFPIVRGNEVQGGPFTSTNLVGLSNIPVARLTVGSLGYAQDTGLYHRLTSTSPVTWSGIDASNFTNAIGGLTLPLALTNGGTGATNAAAARSALGLSLAALTNTNNASFVAALNLVTNQADPNSTTALFSFIASGSGNQINLTQTNEGAPVYNFIGSGSNNVIDSTSYGFIGSGRNNSLIYGWQGQPSSIVGGYGNTIYTDYSFIGGGYENIIYGGYEGGNAVITGGRENTSSNSDTVVAGGLRNAALGRGAVVSGGRYNTASGYLSTIGGGGTTNSINGNVASGNFSTISGGERNIASSNYATVSGGSYNVAQNEHATVSGGNSNQAIGKWSVVAGGDSGYASGDGATVVGGYQNAATGANSFAAGNKARATNSGSFVWADHQDNSASIFSSAANDSFNVRASGGSYFNGGGLYVYKTNTGPFEGLANLISSNNTTLSNETLFRVGVAEETNRSAQFGFRAVRTNNGGEGVAVFSVYGYNALMMIGPSDRSRTNTATNRAVEADIWTVTPTNRVVTLRDTNTGALTIHQEIGFGTNAFAIVPANTTTPAAWLRVWIGTNGSYRLPLYQ
jgi:hypothetical protein